MNRVPFAAQAIVPSLAALALSLACMSAQASVNISAAATKNMSCSAGVCSPTAKKAVLNVGDLAGMLQTSDAKVVTGSGAVTIEVTAPLSWASASRLTFDANLNVSIKAAVTVAGPGGLTIVTNDGGSGGDLLFSSGAKIDFWDLGSSLIVNGKPHTLVADIATLARDIEAEPAASYALANDYDASKDGAYKTSPISTRLAGRFEGLGHTIKNLTIKKAREKCVGLFSSSASSGILRDIVLTKANVNIPHHASVGALVGCNSGLVVNDYSNGSVYGGSGSEQKGHVGGLVGLNDNQGNVSNSVSAATVSGSNGSFVGGLVGQNGATILTTISRSHATGAVSSSGNFGSAGGLVGYNSPAGTIFQSYATGPVSGGSGVRAGGLGGDAEGSVTQSYATGSVSGGSSSFLGGLVGDGNDIIQSYATGSVTGSESLVGGLAGAGGGGDQSYAIGAVTGGSDSIVGGLIGYVEGLTAHEYWDTETSGQSNGCGGGPGDCSGATGLTTEQFQSGLPAGFDASVWGEDPNINGGFPYLLALPPAE